MIKINILFFILLLLFPKSFLYPKHYSNLLQYVREDLTNKVILFLPQRDKTNVTELCFRLSRIEKNYSLNKVETAHAIYTWIHRNINYEDSNNLKYNKTLDTIIKTGKGSPNSVTSLFKTMCNNLDIEVGNISGYIKLIKKIEADREWNYIIFNNTYYLIDVSSPDYYSIDYYFGTKPEMFIHTHFPKETKWQLLNEIISFKQFLSQAYLSESFDFYGYKTISPDSFLINETFIDLNLTYDKSILNKKISFYCEYIDSFGKEEIIECKHYLISEGEINLIIKSISEEMDYINIYSSGYNGYSFLSLIASFKINHKKNNNFNLRK